MKLYLKFRELIISKDHILLPKKIYKDYGDFEEVNVPWGKQAAKIKTVRILDSVKSNCMRNWFMDFVNLTILIDFQNLDVSDCKDFYCMFWNCSNLQDLISLQNLDVSNGKDFVGIFCYKKCS